MTHHRNIFSTLPCAIVAGLVLFALLPLCARANDSIAARVNMFGTQLPQEKVFLHTDNSAYFLGDTIHYQAYVTRTDRGTLSSLSGVLYVELLNADGYLVERQIVRLQSGLGIGSIVLATGRTHYAGYYELRAYTRWMLNFGRTELPHKRTTEEWFVRRHMARDFYVDYDKIYSRTFPVYDKPQAPGEYFPDMTQRPMQRLLGDKKADERPVVSLFPEGGHLIAGLRNRLYFEASTAEGRHMRGTLVVRDKDGNELARAATEHRGKGMAEIAIPSQGALSATFITANGDETSVAMPRTHSQGVVLRPVVTADSLLIKVSGMRDEELGISLSLAITHNGVVVHNSPLPPIINYQTSIVNSNLPQGVLDLTVYDEQGRIWADRLVFNNRDLSANRITVNGLQDEYLPYEPINLTIDAPIDTKAVLSVSVTDADNSAMSADNGNILTEMLMASEIKGFIEEPTYYFEADDDIHRLHLDLLMGTQGWRRFDWRVQSHPELFNVAELNEARTPRMNGAVYNYEGLRKADALQEAAENDLANLMQGENDVDFEALFDPYANEDPDGAAAMATAYEAAHRADVAEGAGRERYQKNPGNLNRDVTVRAEFITAFKDIFEGEATTDHSMFNIEQPDLEDQFYMHLAAADTTRWSDSKPNNGKKARKAKYTWICPDEDEYPEFYVRLSDPFPRHAHPYSFYRTTLVSGKSSKTQKLTDSKTPFDDRLLDEVTVTSQRKGKRRFDSKHPAFAMSAYTAFNNVCDAGLCPGVFVGANRLANDVARLLVGDMGVDRQYKIVVRRDGLPASHTMSEAERAEYDKLENLDSVVVYTDYAPRHYANPLWNGENQPEVIIDVRRFPNKARQVTYRDRFYIRQGFNVCADFYHPDYSQAQPPAPKADTRRTLVWRPLMMLKPGTPLVIEGYNCGKTGHLRVTVNGITARGTALSN